MNREYFVYILTNKKKGTLYVGVTSNLVRRIWIHRNDFLEGFTKKYSIHRLVYFEIYNDVLKAVSREKYLKGKKRAFKLGLIEKDNPEWTDLYETIA